MAHRLGATVIQLRKFGILKRGHVAGFKHRYDGISPRCQIQTPEHRRYMAVNGVRAYAKPHSNFFAAKPLRDKAKYFQLPRAEKFQPGRNICHGNMSRTNWRPAIPQTKLRPG